MTKSADKGGPPYGSSNRQIEDEPRSAVLHLRVTPTRKARYVKAAQRAGMRLTDWITEHMDKQLEDK